MKYVIILLVLSILNLANAQNNKAIDTLDKQIWTLKDLIEYAYLHNLTVEQFEIQAKIVENNYKQAKLGQIPNLNSQIQGGSRFGRSQDPYTGIFTNNSSHFNNIGLGSSIPIYNYNSLKNTISFQSFNLKAALEDIKKAKNDLATVIAAYYLQSLSALENIKIAELQINQTLQQLEITRKRVETGVLPELNLYELETQLSNDSANLIAVKFQNEQAVLSIKASLRMDLNKDIKLDMPPLDFIYLTPFSELSPELIYLEAIDKLPEQKGFKYRILAAKKNVTLAKSNLYPSLNGSIQLSTTFSSTYRNFLTGRQVNYLEQLNNNFGQSLGLSLNIPIFNNKTARRGLNLAQLNVRNVENMSAQANQTLHVNIYNAYINAVNSFEKWEAGKKLLISTEKTYNAALKRYENGLLGVFELISIQNNFLRAKIQNLTNRMDYIFKVKLLELYKGDGIKL